VWAWSGPPQVQQHHRSCRRWPDPSHDRSHWVPTQILGLAAEDTHKI